MNTPTMSHIYEIIGNNVKDNEKFHDFELDTMGVDSDGNGGGSLSIGRDFVSTPVVLVVMILT